MAVLSSRHLGGQIARPLIPIGMGVPLVFGYIALYLRGRLQLSVPLGAAALNVSIIVVFLVVLWFLARTLNKSDAERKQAEAQLELQAQLFNILPDAVVYGNKDLSITQMNPAAREIFEVNEGPTNHLVLDDLFKIEMTGGQSREAVRKGLWGESGFWRGETDLITRSGKKIQAMVLLQAVKNEDGEKAAWFGVYTDISFLRLNEELKAANNYLEQLAFISSHDIKSPILTLQGLVDLMYSSENLKPEDRQLLDMQKNVIRQMQQTNNALNEMLKLRKNLKVKDIRESETLPLDKIMNNITGLLETEVGLSGAQLETDISEISETRVPRVYFQSLFYNLICNSIKYRDPERQLVIKFTGRQTRPDTIQFIIEDNGLGFDLEHNKHRIFGMFKRFHSHVEGQQWHKYCRALIVVNRRSRAKAVFVHCLHTTVLFFCSRVGLSQQTEYWFRLCYCCRPLYFLPCAAGSLKWMNKRSSILITVQASGLHRFAYRSFDTDCRCVLKTGIIRHHSIHPN